MNAVSFRPHYLFAWLYLIIFSAALSAREVIVIGGTGSGSYPRDDSVTITANSASGRRAMSNSQNSGMVFLRWWSFNQTTSEMGLYRETEPQQTFVPTGNHRVEMAAVSGKIQVICPPLAPDAPNQFSILCPKSAENPLKRYPLEVHVTLAGYDNADPADIFQYLKIGASWFPTPDIVGMWHTDEIASFWDASAGGTEIKKDGFIKNELFTAEGSKLIGKIWYQPLWTYEQLKSEDNPNGKEKLPNLSFKATLNTVAAATDYRKEAQAVSVKLPPVEILDKDKKAVAKLKVGKMTETGVLSGTGGSATLDIDKDSDRFYIRFPGGASLGGISVKVSTTDNPHSAYNDNATQIDLQTEGNDVISKSLLLVSDDIDDVHPVDGISDDATGDRTHKVQLGGNFKIEEIKIGTGAWQTLGTKMPVPVEKTVKVSVIIIRETVGGAQSASSQAVEDEIKRVKERYAQIGLDLDSSINVIDPPTGVDLSDGLNANPLVNAEVSSLLSAASVATSDLEVFVVNDLKYTPGSILYGVGFSPFAAASFGYSGVNGYENTVIINWGSSSLLPGRQTFAHEIGHILTNAGHSGGPMNLMESGPTRNTTNDITGGRRLDISQQNAIHSSPLSSNP